MWKPPFDPAAQPEEAFRQLNTTREAMTTLIAWMQERERHAPAEGSFAPDFAAERLSPTGERTGLHARLSEERGRPVALVFGSYT